MQKFIMCCGLPASGKTYWATAKCLAEDVALLSSDGFRETHPNCDNNAIFELMHKYTIEYLEAGETVIYDATNLARKHRMAILTEVKRKFPAVFCRIEIFMAPIKVLKERNSHRTGAACVPDEVFQKFIRGFQFPQYFEGWDEINVNELSIFDKLDMLQFYGFDQKNPFHTADLGNHLLNARQYCEEHEFSHIVQDAAWFHDIGKFYTQTFGPDGVAHYYGHENVGAYYFAMCCWNSTMWTKEEKLVILFLINYHMRPYHWTAAAYKRDCQLFGARNIYWLKQLHQADLNAH